ncbi:hypothetical protein C9374_005130 [Naegleria lovaniensis]|uniref:Uncharacterized protein n=1 Tax=Naegleria lovaniensis TaxID=51637 RepID=A0AA88KKC9_NAELO|nr:uncharacterized protein C9374_005130 [Naegleria lovaniensis]KAG2382550.1 hypothetical protein C9374_005130 [Naegleria lovaniensis]
MPHSTISPTAYNTCKNILNLVPTLPPTDDTTFSVEGVYVSVAHYEYDSKRLDDSTPLIPDKQTIRVNYDYPLSTPAIKEFKCPEQGFTQKQLVALICEGYKEIYDEEEKSTSVQPQPMNVAHPGCHLVNRCRTTGVYGIWGHCIGDLMLTYDASNDLFTIRVDS